MTAVPFPTYRQKYRNAGVPVPVGALILCPGVIPGGRPLKPGKRESSGRLSRATGRPVGRPRKPGKRTASGHLSQATGRPRTGRPIRSTHKRAAYWRRWKAARLTSKPTDNEGIF